MDLCCCGNFADESEKEEDGNDNDDRTCEVVQTILDLHLSYTNAQT